MEKSCLVILIPFVFLLGSCQGSAEPERATIEVTDQEGTTLEVDQPVKRVISLAPSMTELLGAIKAEGKLVGRSQNCDYPSSIIQVETVTVYPHLDVEKILSLSPDLVVTYQGMTPSSDIKKLRTLGVNVYVAKMNSIEDWNRCALSLADILDIESIDTLAFTSNELPDGASTLVALCGVDPLYGFGSSCFQDAIFEAAGFRNVLQHELEAYPRLNEETILSLDPDYLLVAGEDKEMLFAAHPNLKRCTAYKNGQVIECPTDLISRPGGRVKETILYLVEHAE